MDNPLTKKILEEPIVLPRNPLWEVVRVFGKDEIIALVIGTTATALVGIFVHNALVLAITGPVVEKTGFFIVHIKERSGMKKGFHNMMKDLLVHDPLYAILMYLGLKLYHVPAWILAISSFVVALAMIAVGEVLITEMLYRFKFFKFKQMGFGVESYLESRFFIKKADTEKLLLILLKSLI
jgi:hypothetical protein